MSMRLSMWLRMRTGMDYENLVRNDVGDDEKQEDGDEKSGYDNGLGWL